MYRADLSGVDTELAVDHEPDVDARDELGNALVSAHRDLTASTARIFELIVEMEDTESYLPTYSHTAAWLSWHLGISTATARRYVRVANQLRDLPVVAAAHARGLLTLDRLQLLLRVVEPDMQHELVDFAVGCADIDTLRQTIKDIETARSDAEHATDDQPRTRATMWWRNDALHLNAVIQGADGVMVERAIERVADRAPTDPDSGGFRPVDDRHGEAIVQLASMSLAADTDHDRATVVVHVNAADLDSDSRQGWDAAGRVFSTAELDRLLCDARIQPCIDDSHGLTIGVGRTTRTIPPWLLRSLNDRDGGCRFPGCGQTRWLHAHHVIHWADGGPTNLDNLILLCGFHHRMLHNDGWSIDGNPNFDVRFVDRWGFEHGRRSDPPSTRLQDVLDQHRDDLAAERTREFAISGSPP